MFLTIILHVDRNGYISTIQTLATVPMIGWMTILC